MTQLSEKMQEFFKKEAQDQNKSISLRDKVYEYFNEKMRRGDLFPGTTIDQKEICKELGISRTPLTNALVRLEAEGIVTIHPRSRIVVNRLDEEDIQYLYDIIGTIEGALIARGFSNYTPDLLEEMESWNNEMREHILNGDLVSYDPLHYKFHQVFVQLAPNKFSERILRPIKNRLWDIPKKSFPQQWYLDACSEHQYVINSLREKNLEKAVYYQKYVHWDFEYNKKYIQMAYYL